ncbi:uncharacterized protein [Diadema antillarum]|uniref:uncharacterized protein n=1 Tax=Diadema antillarum TaxID=105358 RepID=UPI003A83B35E
MAAKFDAAEFVKDVTLGRLRGLVKAQLIEVATHVDADIRECSRKKEIFAVLVKKLELGGVEYEHTDQSESTDEIESAGRKTAPSTTTTRPSEMRVDSTQLELARLVLEKEKMKAENLRLEQELMQRQIELTQAQSSSVQGDRPNVTMSRQKTPDIAKMANTVPRFDEEDVDSFFFSFERIARNLEWEKKYWSMIVHQKLTGKAQSVVSALSDEEANSYDTVKEAVLLAYQLVPEAYRQKFRGYRRDTCSSGRVDEKYKDFISQGTVTIAEFRVPVVILRDTGATQSLMVGDVKSMPIECNTGRKVLIHDVNGGTQAVPLFRVNLDSGLISGEVIVGIVPFLPMDGVSFLLGNDLAGGRVSVLPVVSEVPVYEQETEKLVDEFPEVFPTCAITRFRASEAERERKESESEISLHDTFFGKVTSEGEREQSWEEGVFSQPALIKAQMEDEELLKLREGALTVDEAKGVPECFYVKSGVLMRKWRPPDRPADEDWTIVNQIVVPPPYRKEILRLAHEIPMAGHMGVKKTLCRIRTHFFWPKMRKDVSEFCRTCHECQVVGNPQHAIRPAPLIPIPAFEEPFSRVMIDCVGPLPKSKSGCQYLLTVMDVSTRYAEAFPLRSITAKSVLNALLTFFTRYGLPKEIQSDQGSNFMSRVFQELMYQLGIQQIKSSAYHPQSQGALERYHQTLKTMLKVYCQDNPRDWDKGIPFLLFAAREVPNESTGFSPFELVFGHEPRGPLKVVKEQLLSDEEETDSNALDYISMFRERLVRANEVAREHLKTSQQTMKERFDRKAQSRVFEVGDKVLVLLPLPGDALKAKFSGPYVVERKLGKETYVVSMPDRRKTKRVCHVNMLKKYHERVEDVGAVVSESVVHSAEKSAEEFEHDAPDSQSVSFKSGMIPRVENSKALENPELLLSHLSDSERQDVVDIFQEFPEVCSDKLGCAKDTVHTVDVGENAPIKQHPYRIQPAKREQVDREIDFMLGNGIIEPSNSNWSSPVVLVPKADGTSRFCIDYRKVNTITKTDSFPLPLIEECIDRVGSAEYVSKLDLMKGYWQVPLDKDAREISAFVTPSGLYQCRVMPFGMKNSPATFQRMMNRVIAGHDNCVVYIDDVLVFSNTWEEHVAHLRELFRRLSHAGLVVNLAKCEFGKACVTYLGHKVGRGSVAPRDAKVRAIVDFPVPASKRELQRFLGMCGFYRRFVPNFSHLVVPLTDLLKKGKTFQWSASCQDAFQKLKAVLMNDPVLIAPNFERSFQLATDASDRGVGAVLLQDDDNGHSKPVCFFSKKLNRHQQKYSTVEKECLSVVLAVQHFEAYLDGGRDIVVYTDHNPLTFLERFKHKNQRLFRWSLILQPYPLRIVHIAGKDNKLADALSRV